MLFRNRGIKEFFFVDDSMGAQVQKMCHHELLKELDRKDGKEGD